MHWTKGTNIFEGLSEILMAINWGRSAPFYGRSHNRRIDVFGATYETICPTVLDGDMTVI